MRLTGMILVGLLFAAGAAEAATPFSVQECRDEGFSIESPVPLVKGTGTYRGAVAGVLQTTTYSGELDNIRYTVSIVDISNRIPEAVNLYLEMEFLSTNGVNLLGDENVGIEPGANRHYGRQLVYETKDGSLVRKSLIYNKGKIYVAEAAILPGGDKQSIAPERFTDSILFDLDGAVRDRCNDPNNFNPADLK